MKTNTEYLWDFKKSITDDEIDNVISSIKKEAYNQAIHTCKGNVKLQYETYLIGETNGVNVTVDLDSLEKLKI